MQEINNALNYIYLSGALKTDYSRLKMTYNRDEILVNTEEINNGY